MFAFWLLEALVVFLLNETRMGDTVKSIEEVVAARSGSGNSKSGASGSGSGSGSGTSATSLGIITGAVAGSDLENNQQGEDRSSKN